MQDYIAFLQYCLDESLPLPENTKNIDWKGLQTWAEQQAIAGVVFEWLKVHGEGLKIPKEVLLQWFALSEQIKQRNMLLNKRCVELTEMLRKDGFQCCILKGQGNAVMYPNPLTRTSGDIDVWVDGERNDIISFAKKKFSEVETSYHHVEGKWNGCISIELHFFPGFIFNPLYNHRLRKYFEQKKVEQFMHLVALPDITEKIPVPTSEFNVVFQLSHIFKHFISGGVGLRQVTDYYYVLKRIEDPLRLPLYKGRNLEETLKYLGLWKFAGAVMYVMRKVFGLEKKYMIAPVDERRGNALLTSILKEGNFGQSGDYMRKRSKQTNHLRRFLILTQRSFEHFKEYPIETISESLYRLISYYKYKN